MKKESQLVNLEKTITTELVKYTSINLIKALRMPSQQHPINK